MPVLLFFAVFALYATTAAPGTLFGDPSEYQFVPAIAGIAHPPGYAFYTLLAKLWQALFPVGTVAFRTNLLAGAVGAWVVAAVYLTVNDLNPAIGDPQFPIWLSPLLSLFVGLSLAAAADFWQHAIHANAHVVSAALAVTHLWLLARWWRTGRDRWLAGFAVCVGLGAAHHPITLMGVPAYSLFIITVRPRILRQWRVLLVLGGCLLLGLTPLLYYPLRSPTVPFGPTDMRTWAGFWRHTTAQGLRGNLFHFGVADQPDRALVFWSLLRLQFLLPVILLIPVGLVYLARRAPKPALLLTLFVLGHLVFTLNTVQDVMAYLLVPFSGLAIAAGIGAVASADLLAYLTHRLCPASFTLPLTIGRWSLVALLLCCPVLQATTNLRRGISLRDFAAAEEWVAAVHRRFDGDREGAVLLSDWEHLTPLLVHAYTQGEELNEQDVEPIYASTAKPWASWVRDSLEEGPVYLPDDRAPVRTAGFRLIPRGTFYRVVAPPARDVAPSRPLDVWVEDRIHILGYDLPATTLHAGDPLVLVLYQSAPEPIERIWMPRAQLGPVEAYWTTDSRLLTTGWLPREVVVERYELPVPLHMPPGRYPLLLSYADLSGGRANLGLSTGGTTVQLATITVLARAGAPPQGVLGRALANLGNQVALMAARARSGWQVRRAFWEEPLSVKGERVLHVNLTWRALASPRYGATVFIHLIDGAGRYVTGHDYAPLGGSCPTYLWFPKWLPGQTFIDPYRLVLPAHVPPGDYWLEVGMYGTTSLRRLPVVDLSGDLIGDRSILGPVRVE